MFKIPASARRAAASIHATLTALLDAFVAAIAPLAERVTRGDGHVAVIEPAGIALHTIRKGRVAPAIHLRQGEPAPEAFRGTGVQLRLPDDQFLTRTLRLPDAGRGYLQPIIAHRLERLTPWRTDKVLYGFDVVEGVAEDGTIAVEMRATSVDIVAPYLARLQASGLVPTGLGSAAEPLETPLRFDLYKGRPDTADGRIRARVASVLAIVFAGLIPVCLMSFGLVWSSEAELHDTETRLATLRSRLGAAGGPGTARHRALIEAKRPETAMVVLIDRLSRALPDNTVLRELDIDAGKVRLVGRSGDAPALIARLEGGAGLRNLRFAAPVIRDSEKRDAFELVAARGVVAETVR